MSPAGLAVEVAVILARQDVELFAAVDPVVVPDVAQVLEDVERPIDGRRDRRRIDRPAALDELAAGDMTVGPAEYVDQRPALGCPAQPAGAQAIPDALPRPAAVDRRRCRPVAGGSHQVEYIGPF